MTWTEPDPITWKGYWPDDDEPFRSLEEPWETYELVAFGREAGEMRNVTLDDLRDVFKQNPQLPMRLIPDNEETVELIAKAIYGEGPTTKHDRIVASAVLAALIGETP